jgi:hypothetical protein
LPGGSRKTIKKPTTKAGVPADWNKAPLEWNSEILVLSSEPITSVTQSEENAYTTTHLYSHKSHLNGL